MPEPTRKPVLRLDRIAKSYVNGRRRTRVLTDVQLFARAGEITAITGPSGSGKTTLLRIMGGLSKPDAGQVRINDIDLYGLRDRKLSRYRNREIGFIFQDYRLLPNYDALENVMVPLMIAGVGRRERVRRAGRALDSVGLSAFHHQRVNSLSGGQEQRVGIARALAMKPSVLIADEPTGNLDRARSEDILRLFQNLRSQQGISIVMVTHDEQLAAQADQAVSIIGGRISAGVHAAA